MWFFSQKEIKREEYFEEIKILIYQEIRLLFSKKTKVFYKVNPDQRCALRYALQRGLHPPALRYALQTTPYFRSTEGVNIV